ncbi:DnaJ-class molecular chaperone with C-terminal Zn finger domain [Xenococcus sp. PCC 7305]|uniref:IMS domain-containing protein n=1 Tax=Xenococcus sp. PCC 7305 TaxID=102125 RepID=UPI0002ACB568|nr:IMS domain-containing protein [Xenococcus sp. PCC 7305]ELS01220.1 DnaJ-class molecular chaperone with C-terminal Zn finger domain [Xenococcus sp. PCC 7305]
MQITLDYYRILSVPIKATQEQVDKSFADRAQQEPRREYSQFAIAARQKLLEKAHQVLSDESQRAAYDAKFFTTISESDEENGDNGELQDNPDSELESSTEKPSPQVQLSTIPEEATTAISPSIEIPTALFAGALLIYYELAEYELILRLGVDYLNNTIYSEPAIATESTIEKVEEDQTENNPEKEDIILSVVLSYLELSREQWRRNKYENAAISGQMGINLLETEQLFPTLKAEIEMDVHKLKPYRILELLAKSPSNSPERLRGLQLLQEMIRQRQGIEGKGNDYSGLTLEEFLHFIQQLRGHLTAQEQQKLFVAEAKRGSGVAGFLAVYALIARGYIHQKPQLILEAQQLLNPLSQTQDISWEQSICHLLLGQTEQAIAAVENSPESKIVTAIKQRSQDSPDILTGICFYGEKWLQEDVVSQFWDLKKQELTLDDYFSNLQVQEYLEQLAPITPMMVKESQKTLIAKEKTRAKTKQSRNFFSWGKPKQLAEKAQLQGANTISEHSSNVNQTSTATLERHPSNNGQRSHTLAAQKGNYPPGQATSPPKGFQQRSQTRYKSPLWLILLKSGMLLMGLIFGLGALGFLITRQTINRDSPEIAETTLNSAPAESTIAETNSSGLTNPEIAQAKPALPVFDDASAQQVIQKWLDSKSAALGKSHQIDKLNGILAPDLLTKWSNTARYYQQTNTYRNYQHNLKISSVVFDPKKPNLATVEAEVQEVAQHYQGSKLNSSQSYDDNLLVRYQLIKKGDNWLIQTSQVLKTL